MLNLLNYLLRNRVDFYPFESRIIEEVKLHLDSDSNKRFQRQIEAINKIQRLSNGKEVNFYQLRHGKPAFDDSLRFPNAADEVLLASLNLIMPDQHAKLKVEVWLAKGRLFSLIFNKPPKQFFGGSNLRAVIPKIADVKIWIDPMRFHAVNTDNSVNADALTGWLLEWHAKGLVTGLHVPLPDSERTTYLARIDARLPKDYLELIDQTEGANLASCVVYGVARIRKIVCSEANYYIVAEIGELGTLAVRDGALNAELYFLHYEDNNVHSVGTSFQMAVANLLKLD